MCAGKSRPDLKKKQRSLASKPFSLRCHSLGRLDYWGLEDCDFSEAFPQQFLKSFPPPGARLRAGLWFPPVQEVAMAYRELGMIEVREVLRRFTLGEPLRAIARGTGPYTRKKASFTYERRTFPFGGPWF